MAPLAFGSILSLNLDQTVSMTDGAIDATIVGKRVFRIDHPSAGAELYFTNLTLSGRSLEDGWAQMMNVTILGGFIDVEHGVWNSASPAMQDQQSGNPVLVFHKWFSTWIAIGTSGSGQARERFARADPPHSGCDLS